MLESKGNSGLLTTLEAEMEDRATYQGFAAKELNSRRRNVMRGLAATEEHHADLWAGPIRALGGPESQRYWTSVGQLIPEDQPNWCESAFHLQRSIAVDQLIYRATTNLAGMIASGLKPRSTFGRHVHTSFAYRLLANASCPVLTIRDLSS